MTTIVACPGCARPIEVTAAPTDATWLDDEQWCPSCRIEPDLDDEYRTLVDLAQAGLIPDEDGI